MKADTDWEALARGLLKAELKRREITYDALSERLARRGVSETSAAIANKISRGRFSAVFLLQCLDALDCKIVRIEQ